MKKTSKTYKLIPSVQIREDIPAPIVLTPAIPVRLQSQDGTAQYAIVDTSSPVSIIPSSIAHALGLEREVESKIIKMGLGGKLSCDLIKVTLILCDEDFSPWLCLKDVPFALLPDAELLSRPNHLILGYDSCLANLKLTIDFARRIIDISAPSRLQISNTQKMKNVEMPSRINEAERLINLGSYNAALVSIAADLEKIIMENLGTIPKRTTLGQLHLLLIQEGVPTKYQEKLKNIAQLRNKAVHGKVNEFITQEEAISALQNAKALIRYFSDSKNLSDIKTTKKT